MMFSHQYMTGLVPPLLTMKAVNELLNTTLYVENKATLNSEIG